jgi:hypothetical protein
MPDTIGKSIPVSPEKTERISTLSRFAIRRSSPACPKPCCSLLNRRLASIEFSEKSV